MSDKDIKNPYHRTLNEYGVSSSLHGISYIFERNQTVHERSFWMFVVIVAIMIGYWLYKFEIEDRDIGVVDFVPLDEGTNRYQSTFRDSLLY